MSLTLLAPPLMKHLRVPYFNCFSLRSLKLKTGSSKYPDLNPLKFVNVASRAEENKRSKGGRIIADLIHWSILRWKIGSLSWIFHVKLQGHHKSPCKRLVRRESTRREGKSMWLWRKRWEGCTHKSRGVGSQQHVKEARSGDGPRGCISSHAVCGSLYKQP